MIQLKNITKKIANKTIIDDLSLHIKDSIVYGLLGPNGAGKTTTIRLLCGIIEPTSGDIVLNTSSSKLGSVIGYMPEETGLYKDMTIEEEIFYFAKLHNISKEQAITVAKPLLERFKLGNQTKKRVGLLSKGNIRKVQFICTLLHSPKLIILDEPFSGLDPKSALVMENEIINLKNKGNTVILSTHIMEHAEIFCDHVFIINQGKKIIDENYTSLKENHLGKSYLITSDSKVSDQFLIDHKMKLIKNENSKDFNYILNLDHNDDLNNFINIFLKNNYSIKSLVKEEMRLRRFFLEKTKYL